MRKLFFSFSLAAALISTNVLAAGTNNQSPIPGASTTSVCFFNDAAFVLRVCDFDFGGCQDINGGSRVKVDISQALAAYGEAHFILEPILAVKTPLNITLRRAGDTVHVTGDAAFSHLLLALEPGNCS